MDVIKNSKQLEKKVEELLKIEEDKRFIHGRDIARERRKLRELVLEAQPGKKVKLPNNSELYVGIKISEKGRISWKDAAYDIARRTDSLAEIDSLIEERRGKKVRRLYYGRVGDENYEKRRQQLDLFTSGYD